MVCFSSLSEPEREPGGRVVHIFSGCAVFEEISREEVRVGGRECEMPLQLPLRQHLELVASITITTRPGRHNHIDGIAVNRIAPAFSPKEIPIKRELELLDRLQFQRWMKIDVIGRADQSGFAEISAARKQRIKRFQI